MWSVAKHNFQKLMQYQKKEVSQLDFLRLVQRSVRQIPEQLISNMVSANRKHVLGYLEAIQRE